MRERALSRADIETLLDALSERLHEKQAFAKLHLVGSACIALAYERERTTLDIDARVDAGTAPSKTPFAKSHKSTICRRGG